MTKEEKENAKKYLEQENKNLREKQEEEQRHKKILLEKQKF